MSGNIQGQQHRLEPREWVGGFALALKVPRWDLGLVRQALTYMCFVCFSLFWKRF